MAIPDIIPGAAERVRLIEVKAFSGPDVSNTPYEETLIAIEKTQAALRDSIEQARELAEESERLVRKHRAETARPPNPAS
ncbi:MAG TPA: hypothetical protein VK614_09285 [Allosphingosinicella sp.]|nr:hypothetical protein [Allosphingosinicella sp.]